jgi:single-stranded-DNA-specific exonuclease
MKIISGSSEPAYGRMRSMQPRELQNIILKNRGISEEQLDSFLNPNYETGLYDPYLFRDMAKAVERIAQAVENKEKIVIYSDYDADGIPGGVILHDFFKKIGYENFKNYIPHRHDEGYGLHQDAVEKLIAEDAKLIITVDLGITAVSEVAYANEQGTDVIITDHHLGQEVLPQAYAILNPHLPGETYPFKDLCGAGVAFKLVQVLAQKFEITPGWEKWLLDMAGLATLSDMVPLVGENRVLATYGLKVLQKTRRPGLAQLFRKMKTDLAHLVEDDITFMLTPRLNAASRLDTPQAAFDLLSETDIVKAGVLADHLTKINDSRKTMVATIMRDVHKRLEERELREVIVIGHPEWRPGVLGLIASKIVETYERPSFVWGGDNGGGLKGSCRTEGRVNVVELMTRAKESFASFGGHAEAGGFVVTHETVHFLEEKLISAYQSFSFTEEDHKLVSYTIDTELSLSDVTLVGYKAIEPLAPFGLGNSKPTFSFPNVTISGMRQFGKTGEHLELLLSQGTAKVKAIAFFTTHESFNRSIEPGLTVTLVGTMERSYFLGRSELRLRIVDVL